MNDKVVKKSVAIRDFIVSQVGDHPAEITRIVSEAFGISRQAVQRHLRALVGSGIVKESGRTKGTRYQLKPLVEKEFVLPLGPGLDVEKFWTDEASPLFRSLPVNVQEICYFGLTEMLENAATHSQGKTALVAFTQTANGVELWVRDDGVGIFQKLAREHTLEDQRYAAFELAKGRASTALEMNSGRGITLAFHSFDQFSILAGSICLFIPAQYGRWLYEGLAPNEGTAICMKISGRSDRLLSRVMETYASGGFDAGITRVRIPVGMLEGMLGPLISRSQSEKLLSGCEEFREVELDFSGVENVGRPFADEIYAAFAAAHPGTSLSWTGANESIESVLRAACFRTASLRAADSRLFPFRFKLGEAVRSLSDPKMTGTISDGSFRGRIGGEHEIRYVVDLGNGSSFSSLEQDLEKAYESSPRS